MPGDHRIICRHFPDLAFQSCPICEPEARYDIAPEIWRKKAIIEVIRNGKPWSRPWDSHFRFGVTKAAIILYSIDIIEQFALTGDPGNLFQTPLIKEDSRDANNKLQIQTFAAFTNSYGIRVDYPYIRFDRIEHDNPIADIGFGQLKAAALVILKDRIIDWLQSLDGWYN